jgi:hypothetical protein
MHLTRLQLDDRRGVRAFLDLPFRIYADIPQWVPPLRPGEGPRLSPD